MSKLTIGLVGCGKAKADGPRKARDLYTSQLFRLSLKHAEQTNDHVFIVSAFHHLISPNDVVQPYDRELSTSLREREDWAGRVVSMLVQKTGSVPAMRGCKREDTLITVYAGAKYADPLRVELIRHGYTNVFRPLDGLQIGERLQWLKDNTETKCPWCKGGKYRKGLQHRCGFKEAST